MQESSKNHSHLRLVFSKDLQGRTDAAVSKKTFEDWGQLELFPSEQINDLLIFAQPKGTTFEHLLKEINNNRVRWVLDIRETPFLSFDEFTREKFFDLLAVHHVAYINIHSFMRNAHAHSVNQFFDAFDSNTIDKAVNTLRKNLQSVIENGPTLVFTDCAPTNDILTEKFTSSLTKSEIKYSPYICELSN